MKRHDEMLLRTAVEALQGDTPEAAQVAAAATARGRPHRFRRYGRLGDVDIIENCGDVQHLLASYRAGTLSGARSALDRGSPARLWRLPTAGSAAESGAPALDWSTPAARVRLALQAFGWALAAVSHSLVLVLRLPGVLAGSARSSSRSAIDRWLGRWHFRCRRSHQLAAGDQLKAGRTVADGRRGACSSSALRWIDVEVNERSVLGFGARGHNMTVSLDNGAVIVQAAKRDSGHLYLLNSRLPRRGHGYRLLCRLRNQGLARRGAARVRSSDACGVDSLVHAGEQITTNDNLRPRSSGDCAADFLEPGSRQVLGCAGAAFHTPASP
jgi:hypothetical protein